MSEIRCSNKKCKWNKGGKCLLFAGVTQLQCKYRLVAKSNKNKKGKQA